MNFASYIEESCKKYPEKTSVVQDETRLSFAQLEERASRLGRALLKMGVQPGDRVAVFQTNCFQIAETMYAVGKIGGIFVNLNFRLKGEETSFILNNAGPRVLIFGERYMDMIQGIRKDLPSVEHYVVIGEVLADMKSYEAILDKESPDPLPCCSLDPQETACLIYTSGTTGIPKGAMLTHANLVTSLTDTIQAEPGTLLLNVPMYHIAGVSTTLMPLYQGNTLVILTQFETGRFLEIVEKERVAFTYMVPTMLQGVLDHPDFARRDLASLKTIGYGASPMPFSLLLRAKGLLKADFINYFGLTECSIVSLLTQEDHRLEGSEEDIKRKTHRLPGIGHAIPEIQVRIVDDQDRDMPMGAVGEIVCRGYKVMKGYWNNPKATEEALRGGWLHTGDLAFMEEDGYLYLSGRKKDMIIRGGENIYPVEIENALHAHPKVQEAAVIGVPDEVWGEIVKAVIVLKPGATSTPEEIINYCKEKLASYKKPQLVEFREALPKNAMQKVLKNVLRDEYKK